MRFVELYDLFSRPQSVACSICNLNVDFGHAKYILVRIYDGNDGNEQQVFIKDAQIRWKAIIANANLHLSIGFTQYDYNETWGAKLGDQARRVLDNYMLHHQPFWAVALINSMTNEPTPNVYAIAYV